MIGRAINWSCYFSIFFFISSRFSIVYSSDTNPLQSFKNCVSHYLHTLQFYRLDLIPKLEIKPQSIAEKTLLSLSSKFTNYRILSKEKYCIMVELMFFLYIYFSEVHEPPRGDNPDLYY